jgi:hypothetical protein
MKQKHSKQEYSKPKQIYLSLIGLILASLACSIFIGGPEYPANPVPYSPTAVESFNNQLNDAMLSATQTGVVSVQFTEEQITSFLILKMQEQDNPPFTDPQVLLRNNQMQILGKMKRGIFAANISIILNVSVDESGLPKIEVASADFGPFPAPEGLNSAISALTEEAFTGSFGPAAIGIRLESITIADGVMTLTGRIK